MPKTVAEQFADTPAAAGVKRIYGIVGDSLNGLGDAIRRRGKIEWLHVRHEEAEVSALVSIYSLISRMRVLSSSAVVEKAVAVVRMIPDTYFAPNKTFPELRVLMNSDTIDPLRAFSEECRAELQALKAF
jgi:Thiamine pyrophosphate enzyme, N-terminal TPP binding domain